MIGRLLNTYNARSGHNSSRRNRGTTAYRARVASWSCIANICTRISMKTAVVE
jgi:hypothetical protein